MPEPSILYVSSVVQGDVLIASISINELRDATQAYAVRDELLLLLNTSQARSLVLDLEQVRYIGSIGFLAFLGVRRHLGDARIVLCNMSETIRQMFAVCRLIPSGTASDAPFEVAATVPAAVARIAGA